MQTENTSLQAVIYKKAHLTRIVKQGFSWSCFWGGSLTLVARNQTQHALLCFIISFFSFGFMMLPIMLIYGVFANRLLEEQLLNEGWEKVDG